MWSRLFLVFLVGAAAAEPSYQAWKTDTEYEYNVRGRTLAALHDVADQYTGIVLRARLTVKPTAEDTLEAKLWRAQYAHIHTKLPGGWKSEIPDNMLELKQFPISENVFEIKMRHGVVRELIVDKDIPTWEVNVLKSVVSQLQVDTQGENLMASRYNQEPEGNRPNAMYKTMEDSVSGKCEVLYDISSLPQYVYQSRSDLVPMPELRGEGEVIDIAKTKNYSNCEQRASLHFGITGSNKWEPSSNNGEFMSRYSVSRIVITGDLKSFTIQSSVTTNKVDMSPGLYENQKGMVGSRVNLTLAKMGPVSSGPWSTPANPESTGNLVYSFNNPFAGPGEEHRSFGPAPGPYNSEERRDRYAKNWKHEDDSNDSSASRSSKSANSLENDDNQLYWVPKPTLNEAPATPLLPFYIGYGGRSIDKAENFDSVAESKTLTSQIGSDLQNPNSITDEQTLEKFTILARLIRTMSTEQIAEAQREIYQSDNEIDPHDESQSVRRNTWSAFRDAVAQAGTGPALVTIKNWIKERKIKGAEAASIVGSLSKTARTPTPEYMDAFFELATMPETINEEILNSTAIITFAELIRYSQVNHESAHSRYPVHVFGRFSPKHNPAIFRDYVPYMAEQLKKSIQNNEAAKSHVYIRALGNVAHPNILAIFEPYLEGKTPASTFQRTMMVWSMNKLASLRPRLARGVFYRIYQNTAEAHQVRCAAVVFLMSTNPPESMLQRMAEFTNYDHSKHVNAAVRSSIESASDLKTRGTEEIARKARNVRSLLNKESYGFDYSKNYYFDNAADEINIAYQAHTAYISSDDSFVPQAFYASMKAIYGDFKAPKPELAAMVSSVKELYNEVRKHFKHHKEPRQNTEGIQFSAENIAKLLKIEGQEKEDFEGAFWMKTKYNNRFMSFDRNSFKRIPEFLNKVSAAIKEGRNFNMAKLESYDLTLSFPMESGFPFVYTFKVPTLLKLSGSVKGENAADAMKGSVDLRFVYSMQVQAKLGFVAPFEHQHYMAGVIKNFQAYAPIRADISYGKSDKVVTLKLRPIEQNEKYKLLHYSVVPFTSRHNILNLSPIAKDEETHQLRDPERRMRESVYGGQTRGINFKVYSDSTTSEFNNKWSWDLFGYAAFFFAEEKIQASKTEMVLIPNPSSDQSVVLSGSFETLYDEMTKYDENRSKSSPRGEAPKIKSTKMNDPQRRHELIKQAAEGIAAANAFAIDVGVELPGQEPGQFLATVAFANSDVDEKSRGLMYWRVENAHSHQQYESCIGLEGKGTRSSVSLEEAPKQSRSFDVDLREGETCEAGVKIQIHGEQKQTEDYTKLLKTLPAMLQCLKEMKRGTESTPACQEARIRASTMDKSILTFKFDPKQPRISEGIAHAMSFLDATIPNLMRAPPVSSIGEDALQISMNLYEPGTNAQFEIESSEERLIAYDIDIGPLAPLATNVHPELSASERASLESDDESFYRHVCQVDSDWATTFDEATYPIHLGKCWHVAMTTYPKNTKNDRYAEQIEENMKLSVVVRDAPDNRKDVKFVLGNYEVQLTSRDSKVHVELNGNPVDFSDKHSYYRQKNAQGHLDFELYQRPDGSVKLLSSKYDVDATYNGQRVQIKASGKYRNDVRGLCGNYDGEPVNDFTSPNNCILSQPELFAASYAMTSNECQGPALENSKKVRDANCVRQIAQPGNVVSDQEAGRAWSGKHTWGYHNDKSSQDQKHQNYHNKKHCMTSRTKVIEEADQICFSLRPVPSCTANCKPVYTKFKVLPFYCMPKGEAAQQMADRVQQGANPDLSQKKPSKTTNFDMPVRCQAA